MDLNNFFGLRDVVEVLPKEWMHDYTFTLITTLEELKAYVDRAIAAKYCALDLETTGLDNRFKPDGTTVDKIVGYCMSYDGREGVYVPVRHSGEASKHNLDPKQVAQEIQRLVLKAITIYHNSLFDHEFLEGEGVEIGGHTSFEDTLILSYLRDSAGKKHGLKYLSSHYLNLEMLELKELFHEDIRDYDFSSLDPAAQATLWYAGADGICTWLLFDLFRTHKAVPRLAYNEESQRQFPVVDLEPTDNPKETVLLEQAGLYAIEKGNVPATRWMERNRPLIDLDYLSRTRYEVGEYLKEVMKEIADGFSKYGFAFSPEEVSKPQRLGEGLDYLQAQGLLKAKLSRTENTGQVQTSDDVIEKLAEKVGEEFPFINKIRTFRRLLKVEGTYLKPLQHNTDGFHDPAEPRNPSHVLQDSTTRFSFNPHRVDTGRFAASKGRITHGYSGINIQSAPACYNRGKFSSKRILSRPSGPGRAGAELYPNLVAAREKDFLIRVYDNHFIHDPYNDEERCVALSCEGCPFIEKCRHDQVPNQKEDGCYEKNTKVLSLDSAVRPAIKARDGFVIAAIDQSGVELRVAANMSKEPKWINEFFRCSSCNHEFVEERSQMPPMSPPALCPMCGSDKIGDLHTLTTQIVYGENILAKPDFKLYRQRSKGANFSVLYGGGGSAVARATGVSKEEGAEIKDKMLSGLPKLNDWISATHIRCKKDKQVKTGVGRIIRLPDIDNHDTYVSSKAKRNAVNGIIQGTATGDLTKYAMSRIYTYLKANDLLDACRLMICVHDELVFEIRKDKLDELIPVITHEMTELGRRLKWPVPLRCDVELGPTFDVCYNWNEFHPYNPTKKAPEPVPKSLWSSIQFYPGMWYVDEEGNEIMPIPLEQGEEVSVDAQMLSDIEEQKREDVGEGTALRLYKEKYMAHKGGPIVTYRVLGNSVAPMDEAGKMWILRHMRSIRDYCLAEDRAEYTLRVESWDGEPLISEDAGWCVDVESLRIITGYLGIRGQISL